MIRLLFCLILSIYSITRVYSQDNRVDNSVIFSIGDIDSYPHFMMPHMADYFSRIANENYSRGSINYAINYCNKALYIIENKLEKDHDKYLGVVMLLANLYDKLGNYDCGRIYHNKAIHIAEDRYGKNSQYYTYTLANLAISYSRTNDYTQAIELYKKSLSCAYETIGEFDINYSNIQCNMATCYANNGNYIEAIDIYSRALNQIKSISDNLDMSYGIHSCNLAYCYYKVGDINKAISLCKYGLKFISNESGDTSYEYIQHLWNLSEYYYVSDNPTELTKCWNKCLHSTRHYISDQYTYGIMNPKDRELFWDNTVSYLSWRSYLYSQYIGSCVLDNQYNHIGEHEYYVWHDTFAGLSYNSSLISKCGLLKLGINVDNFVTCNKFQSDVDTSIKDDIIEDDILRSQICLSETSFLKISWRDILRQLNKKGIAIEFVVSNNFGDHKIQTPKYSAALILRKGWNAPKFVELCKLDELEELYIKGDKAYNTENSAILYNLIWSKLEPYINDGDNVYFAPDGLLYQMNIEVLQDANGRRANEKWNLHRVSSTRELCMEKPTVDINSAVLYGSLKYTMDDDELLAASRTYSREDMQSATRGFVADSTMRKGWNYLPETKTEVEAIAQMCESHNVRAEIFSETSGNEESFKALSGKKTPIIHLATHGFFYKNEEVENKPFFETMHIGEQPIRPDNSLKRSGLILAGAQKAWLGEAIPDSVEDGILLAEEIAAMDLTGTDLVVLSACETGLGEITSEGVFGLQRAFKKAGVQTLIMSLWSVNDLVASLFMRVFYQEWLSGKTKHEAFAIAQNTVRESYEGNDWAAFIMLD